MALLCIWNAIATVPATNEKVVLVKGRCLETSFDNGLVSSVFEIVSVIRGDVNIVGKQFTATYSEGNLFGAATSLITIPGRIAPGEFIDIWIRPTTTGDYEAVTRQSEINQMPYAEFIPFPRVIGRRGMIPQLDERLDKEYHELAEFISDLNTLRSKAEAKAQILRHITPHETGFVVVWAILSLGDIDGSEAKVRLMSIFFERGMPLMARLAADACLVKIDAHWTNSSRRLRQIEKFLDSTGDAHLISIAFRRILSSGAAGAIECLNRIAASDLLESDKHLTAYLRTLSMVKDQYSTLGDVKDVDEFFSSLVQSTSIQRIKKHVGLLQSKHLKYDK